ncbi:hypothetical protein ACROYT_G018425 [Oculina patagonica]
MGVLSAYLTKCAAAPADVCTGLVVLVTTVRLILGVLMSKVVVIVNVFTDQVVSVSPVRLIPIVLAGKVVAMMYAFQFQVVSVYTVRLILVVLPEKVVVIVNVFTVQVVSGKCQNDYDGCDDHGDSSEYAIIGGGVGGSLLLVICPTFLSICYAVRRRRRQRALNYGRVIEVETAIITATITTTVANIQSNPPLPAQEIPPSYPCHPPLDLQFEQQQHTTKPPPYHPGTMAASEQPPPYTEAPQGGSGGVDASSPSFSSAPPVLQ